MSLNNDSVKQFLICKPWQNNYYTYIQYPFDKVTNDVLLFVYFHNVLIAVSTSAPADLATEVSNATRSEVTASNGHAETPAVERWVPYRCSSFVAEVFKPLSYSTANLESL